MISYIEQICKTCDLTLICSTSVGGGDINITYAVETNKGKFFLKLNSATSYPDMFEKEAEGLKALQSSLLLKVPEVITFGVLDGQQYLLLEWLEKAGISAGFWDKLAEGLAEVHQVTNRNFGWPTSNYIGYLNQENNYEPTWANFMAQQRIMPLVEKLYDMQAVSKADLLNADKLCLRLERIFPAEPPALVHGDLWVGNFMAVKGPGETSFRDVPSIYDPAVYFGHREMDLGMSLLFGGFNKRFYEAYDYYFPLETNWRKRVSLTQLYPLLVHAILFGGGYVNQCKNILAEFS